MTEIKIVISIDVAEETDLESWKKELEQTKSLEELNEYKWKIESVELPPGTMSVMSDHKITREEVKNMVEYCTRKNEKEDEITEELIIRFDNILRNQYKLAKKREI